MKASVFLAFALILAVGAGAKQLSVSPLSISIEYTVGESQPSDRQVVFTNSDNDTFTLSFSEAGDASNFFNISPTTYFYVNESGLSKILTVSFSIPQTTTEGLYSGSIVYDSSSVPVFVNVKKQAVLSACRITVPFREYSKTVQRNTLPFKEVYDFKMTSKCVSGVNLNSIRTSGSITTSRGNQPIRLTAVPSNFFESGESGSYELEFDVSELQEGVYTTYILLSGSHGDEQVTETVKYDVRVIGKLTPVVNDTFGTLPECKVDSNSLVANETYEFKCVNVNPNLAVNVRPNDFLKGIRVNPTDADIFSWVFQPIVIGETELKANFIYRGAPIGATQVFPLKITLSPVSSQASTEMIIEFLKDVNVLKEGDNLSFLIKDAVSKNLITDAEIYVNGVQSSNMVTVSTGQDYRLTVAKPGYNTVEANFSVVKQKISVGIVEYFVIGESVTAQADVEGVSWTLSGIKNGGEQMQGLAVTLPLSEVEAGSYQLTASKSGYEQGSKNFSVYTPAAFLTEFPEKLSKGSLVTLQLNRIENWEVRRSNLNGTISSVASGTSQVITFAPSEAGTYSIIVRGVLKKNWELKKGLRVPGWINWKTVLITSGVALGSYFIYRRNRSGTSKEEDAEGSMIPFEE